MTLRAILLLCCITALAMPGHAQSRAVLYIGTGTFPENKLLAMTLAGIVNRDSARLYLLNVYETWSYSRTDEQWRDIYSARGGVQFDSVVSIQELVNRFRPFIRGAVTYDQTRSWGNFTGQVFRWQGEAAATIGGLTDRLPAPPALAAALGLAVAESVLVTDAFDGDPPVWVTGRVELPSHPWNNTALTEEQRYLTLLDWGATTLLPRCNPAKFYIREITDWAVRHRMFQVNLAGTDDLDLNSMPPARADILERVLNHMHARNPSSIFHIYGWIRPEPMTQWFAHFGSSFHETLLGNLSWHSSFPVAPRQYIPPSRVDPDTIPLRNKHYLLFVSSEGDASNWVMSFQSGAWLSPRRGAVPIGWGWNLHLFGECPFVAAYVYDTATPNDGIVAVTSPLGYAYPDLWGNDVWSGALDSTRALMARFGVRNFYGYKHYAPTGSMVYRGRIINNSFNFPRYGSFQAGAGVDLTVLYDPLLPSQVPVTTYGTLMFNHTGDGSFYGDASDLNAMANRIITKVRTQSRPSFLLAGYQRFRQDDFSSRPDPGSSDISLPRLEQVVQLVRADPLVGADVEVVTPEKFSVLMRRAVGYLAVGEGGEEGPEGFSLGHNYPNPFNSATVIPYARHRGGGGRADIGEGGSVRLAVHDLLGREIRVLVDGVVGEGERSVAWDGLDATGRAVASGVYLYRLEAPGSGIAPLVRRMVLLR